MRTICSPPLTNSFNESAVCQNKHYVFPFPSNNVYSSKAIKPTTNGKGVAAVCSHRQSLVAGDMFILTVRVLLMTRHWMAVVYLTWFWDSDILNKTLFYRSKTRRPGWYWMDQQFRFVGLESATLRDVRKDQQLSAAVWDEGWNHLFRLQIICVKGVIHVPGEATTTHLAAQPR